MNIPQHAFSLVDMLFGFAIPKNTLWEINIDPGSHRGWKTSFHEKLVIFRVYVYLPEGIVGDIQDITVYP